MPIKAASRAGKARVIQRLGNYGLSRRIEGDARNQGFALSDQVSRHLPLCMALKQQGERDPGKA
jgi:hypothetical protein